MDAQKLISLQIQELSRAETEKASKVKTLTKRFDHLERAFRKEESPRLRMDYELQQKNDYEAYMTARKLTLEGHRVQYDRGMELKKRLHRMMLDYEEIKIELSKKRAEEFKAKTEESYRLLEKAKERRRQEIKARKEEEKKKRIEEMKRRKEHEEEDRRKQAEEDEMRAEQEREREEYAAKRGYVLFSPNL